MVETTRRAARPSPELTPVQELKALDHARPSAPGEHWLVLGAGIAAKAIDRFRRKGD